MIEFLDALQPLTDAGFHCVVPSLPGYGFSAKPAAPGWGVERTARAWATLMARLGYDRYGALGSDWGTSVSASLGQQDPQHVAGIHLMPLRLGSLTRAPTRCRLAAFGAPRASRRVAWAIVRQMFPKIAL